MNLKENAPSPGSPISGSKFWLLMFAKWMESLCIWSHFRVKGFKATNEKGMEGPTIKMNRHPKQ